MNNSGIGKGNSGSTNTYDEAGSSNSESTRLLNKIETDCKDYVKADKQGNEDEANKIRHGLRKSREELLVKVCDTEDKYPSDHPKSVNMLNTLIQADGYLRAAGLDAVVDDSNNPEDLDSSTTPGNDPDQGQDLDI